MKKQETRENIEKLEKVIEDKKRLPKEIKERIGSKVFENIIFALIILAYLCALNLGMQNIPTENYLMDLKVFSVALLITTIILFELAYKKDVASLWFHAIEVMAITIFTVYLIYMYSMFYSTFGNIISTFTLCYLAYYAIKILITRRKTITEYNKSLMDIKAIVNNKKEGC